MVATLTIRAKSAKAWEAMEPCILYMLQDVHKVVSTEEGECGMRWKLEVNEAEKAMDILCHLHLPLLLEMQVNDAH